MGPPGDSGYAIEPVGVEMTRPSQTALVRRRPLISASIAFRWGFGPRWSGVRSWPANLDSSVSDSLTSGRNTMWG